ncbi:MAG: MBL fold metallo-hydrolase [Opitutaceae bacterium]
MKTPLRIALVLCSLHAFALAARAGQKDKTLDVYWIDSEGGGSTLIVTPNDESVLIDTGNPGGRDPGRIVAAAKAAGLSKLDYVLLTHFHGDHFGGGAEVAQQIPIGTIFQRAIPEGDPDGRPQTTFPQQIKAWKDIPAKREALAPGVIIPLKAVTGAPKLELVCLAADKKTVEPNAAQMKTKNPLTGTGETRTIAPSDNDNSAVFVLSFGGFRFFDGGDLTWNYEEKLVTPYNLAGVVDVYQTNHHGLEVSNNPVLMQSLAPNVIVMNNGPRKGGQPGAFASIKKVTGVSAHYQLHKSLNAPEENAPAEFIANTDSPPGRGGVADPNVKLNDGNFIKMSVAPDGKSYTITVPSTGHSRTYSTKAK